MAQSCFICVVVLTLRELPVQTVQGVLEELAFNPQIGIFISSLFFFYLPISALTSLKLLYSYWFSVNSYYQLLRRRMKSPTLIVVLFIYSSISIGFYLMYFEALLLGAYTLKIVISFSWNNAFIISKCPPLSLVYFLY